MIEVQDPADGRLAMRALVVYESMFGNTHEIAEQIAHGLRWRHQCDVVAVGEAGAELLAAADLVVVGGPTHAHGMTNEVSRRSAVDMARKEGDLDLDPDAEGPGLRDWFDGLERGSGSAAAFDTRMSGPAALTGRASKGIAKRLRRHGYSLIAEPESFFVDKQSHLVAGEADRAEEWGKELAAALVAVAGR